MARIEEVTVTLVDDFDGTEAAETVAFSIDGRDYEIDLSRANTSAFRRLLKPYVDRARPVKAAPRGRKATRKRSTRTSTAPGQFDQAEVRAWAKANRIKVAPRGRISNEVVERWRESAKGR